MPTTPQLFVPGPAEIHVTLPGSGTPTTLNFLGWSERGVRIQRIPHFEDVYADIGGTRVPTDQQFMGVDAIVRASVKVYRNDVYLELAKQINVGNASYTDGSGPAGSLGTLMKAESQTYRMLVYPPYVSKSAFSTLVPYNFLYATLMGPDDLPLSVQANAIELVWYCACQFGSDGSFSCYNHVSTGRSAP